jgi:hypothetical protein
MRAWIDFPVYWHLKNLIYVGCFIKSKSVIFPIEIIYSPLLIVIGTFFQAMYFSKNDSSIRYQEFKNQLKKTNQERDCLIIQRSYS